MAYDNRPNLNSRQFDQKGCDTLYLCGHNCICGTGGTISSNSGYQVSGYTILSANGTGVPNAIGIGYGANNRGESSIAIGRDAQACCMFSVVLGCNNISSSCGGNIIGGYGNCICTGNTNTTLIGANNYTINSGSFTNFGGTVVVPTLAILNGSDGILCYNSSTKMVGQTPAGIATASNGLCKQANNNVVLGGTLTGHTIINANAKDLCICNACNINIMGGGVAGSYTSIQGYNAYLCGTNSSLMSSPQVQICFSTTGYIYDTAGTPRGLQYGGDYRSTFCDNSLITKKYVASQISGITGGVSITGATNGVCKYNTTNVCLGGIISSSILLCTTLDSNTLSICTISTNTNCTSKTTIAGGVIERCNLNVPLNWVGCVNESSGMITLGTRNVTSTCGETITLRPDAVYFNTIGSSGGFVFNGDFCTKMNANDRSIVDAGWVKRYVSGHTGGGIGWSCLAKGTTVAGCGAYSASTTLCNSTIFGVGAGCKITTGNGNVAIGDCSLNCNCLGNYNTAVGSGALRYNTSTQNTGIGALALQSNTGGYDNTAVGVSAIGGSGAGFGNAALGSFALSSLSGGYYNIGIGYQPLFYTTNGADNIGIGYRALYCNGTGCDNIGIGYQALFCNTTLCNNIAIGCQALMCNTGGGCNVGIGYIVLCCNTTGCNNTGIGANALSNNGIGLYNTGAGSYALFSNTCGCYNTGVGVQALFLNTCGCWNTAVGVESLTDNTKGCNNVAMGVNVLQTNTCGCYNTAVGNCAGYSNVTGNSNVFLGMNSGYGANGSCRLYIANCGSCSLIYGEFDNKLVKIDCNLQVCKDMQSLTSGGGLILCSPNSTKYCLTVTNAGTLLITAI